MFNIFNPIGFAIHSHQQTRNFSQNFRFENALTMKHVFRLSFKKFNTGRQSTSVNIDCILWQMLVLFFLIFNIFNQHILQYMKDICKIIWGQREWLWYFFVVVLSLHTNSNIKHSQKVTCIRLCNTKAWNDLNLKETSLYCEAIEIEY